MRWFTPIEPTKLLTHVLQLTAFKPVAFHGLWLGVVFSFSMCNPKVTSALSEDEVNQECSSILQQGQDPSAPPSLEFSYCLGRLILNSEDVDETQINRADQTIFTVLRRIFSSGTENKFVCHSIFEDDPFEGSGPDLETARTPALKSCVRNYCNRYKDGIVATGADPKALRKILLQAGSSSEEIEAIFAIVEQGGLVAKGDCNGSSNSEKSMLIHSVEYCGRSIICYEKGF